MTAPLFTGFAKGSVMDDTMSRFVSIGDNCEFGFVQRAHGYEEGALLRWALFSEVDALIRGLETRFAGIFEFDNLVPAGGGGMVLDLGSGIAFHTQMTSVDRNGALEFLLDEDARRVIHGQELGKIQYLVQKFIATLSAGEKILVFKQNKNAALDDVHRIQRAVEQIGTCDLLYVIAQQEETAGSVSRESDRLYRGVIDRFAPYDHAEDVSLTIWTEICSRVLALRETARPARGLLP